MKGFFYRLRGSVEDNSEPETNTFHVSLGELREAIGKESDKHTDNFQIEVEFQENEYENSNQRRRWF